MSSSVLQSSEVIFCGPVRRRTRKPRADHWLGFSCSVSMHVAFGVMGGLLLIKPVEFGVDRGLASLEVQLVAGVSQPATAQVIAQEMTSELVKNSEAVQTPVEEKVETPATQSTLGNSAVSAASTSQGAQTQAVPSYLNNPSPRYPFEARRKGWTGTVKLKVAVSKDGVPLRVEIEQTSGHRLLDEAAVKTVKTWHFNPARLGQVAVESSVVVPVRFDLKDV